jgi:hypothetical protein
MTTKVSFTKVGNTKMSRTTIALLSLLPLALFASVAVSSPDDNHCNVIIDETDNAQLTKAEQIARYNDALLDSVNRYDGCIEQLETQLNEQDSRSSSGAGAIAALAEAQTTTSNQTETDSTLIQNKNTDINIVQQSGETTTTTIPEDIPPADNDSVLQRQIRQAAISETDPQKKKRLWDLYRQYKNRENN